MCVWPQLLPELAEKIVSLLEPNEVPSFRLVNKAAAAYFSSPAYTTIRLWQPVPRHAFAAHWLQSGSTRLLTLKQRRQLMSLTAATGVVGNLVVSVQVAGCLLTYGVFEAAAAAGKLKSCMWLLQRGCPTVNEGTEGSGLLAAAAGGGHQHVCAWLLGLGLIWSSCGAGEAARGGHTELVDWLLERRSQLKVREVLPETFTKVFAGAAHGCLLSTLESTRESTRQRLLKKWRELDYSAKEATLAAAAGSPTPDWAAKVEWLEARGCLPGEGPAMKAAASSDAAARLAWLRGRGYPMGSAAVKAAAEVGNVAALQYLLGEAGVPVGDPNSVAAQLAAKGGHLTALQALHAAGFPLGGSALEAARGGHTHVVTWLVETLGVKAAGMDEQLFCVAAESGNMELLWWLQLRGCGMSPLAVAYAAYSGCEPAVEFVAVYSWPIAVRGGLGARLSLKLDVAILACSWLNPH
ncbi:hypothetical protein GPECTOR_7g1292 [Gonium pectorale]|uniref:F-box domain-containing protein n=1 Tax=Gonium pectorale TaxID=33097 RepID=A0A150GU42_GONPE|nr:hypothetical protein GPECTOR_7g1292 [Gonium pectorale]|eukprot:KXZ53396.1 hypothetical protein GPECTOR_7g1292 [Gonium pectorale]